MFQFFTNTRGNIAVFTAILMPLTLAFSGGAVDFYRWSNQRAEMKELADTLATRGAREFLLANATETQIRNILQAAIDNGIAEQHGLDSVAMDVSVDAEEAAVRVALTQAAHKGLILTNFEPYKNDVTMASTAVARGGMNVCVIALDTANPGAVSADLNADMYADECSILSNSKSVAGVSATGASRMIAGLICSAGGYAGTVMNYEPVPITDCPAYSDPLSEREPPAVGYCDETDLQLGDHDLDTEVVAAVNTIGSTIQSAAVGLGRPLIDDYTQYTLSPGVYCGGINIASNADVFLEPGVYIIKNGPLTVHHGGRLTGEYVSFYLTGDDSVFTFGPASAISLTAQRDGAMAGILFFEDRHAPADREHRILSDDARTLLGTFYLSRGVLSVASLLPVGDKSAYTVIVAKRVRLTGSPTLVLNADYGATDIPPPPGVGPTSGTIFLRE